MLPGVSSTGVVAVHQVLLPNSDQVLMFGRPRTYGPKPPGVIGKDGREEVMAIFDTNKGTYVQKPNRAAPFCGAHNHLSDGTALVVSGDTNGGPGYTDGTRRVRLLRNGNPPNESWADSTWSMPVNQTTGRW